MSALHEIPLTIITVTYNACADLRRTVESVMQQPLWPNIEYIIIDGGSTDGTVAYLQGLPSPVRWISENDNGIYDAMNKGIRMATGAGLLFLNAGDYFTGSVLTALLSVPCFLPVQYKHPVLGLRPIRLRSRKMGLPNCHQGIVFENRQNILYNLNYNVSADFDYYLQFGYGDRLPMHQCSGYVYYDNFGYSQNRANQRDNEIAKILKKHFGWFWSVRFAMYAQLKRVVRRLVVSLRR